MYLKDSEIIKQFLAAFFGIGIACEISAIFNLDLALLSLVYIIGLLIIAFNYNKLKKYIWLPGFGIISIFSFIYIFSYIINYEKEFFEILQSIAVILVWSKSIHHLTQID
jgi:prepilin signal peptidase PulO-like enzyme (type II secretory pathway)